MLWTRSHRTHKVPRWRQFRKSESERTGRCFYCNRETQTAIPNRANSRSRDHYWPKSKGGSQCVIACHRCNQLKADTPPDEFLDKWDGRWNEAPEWPFVEVGFHERYMIEAGRR